MRCNRVAILAAVVLGAVPAVCEQATVSAPQTVLEWLQQEHRFLRRYLAVVQQATHDYSYGYQTSNLLMPVAIDLFTGYVAFLHEAEERFLYPALLPDTSPEQQRDLRLIETDQKEESGSVQAWQQSLEQYEAGRKKLADVVEPIDYLGRMLNRHIVLQEERLFPLLDLLTPQEQVLILKQMDALEHEVIGASDRSRYEQLLLYIEGEIKRIAGRIW